MGGGGFRKRSLSIIGHILSYSLRTDLPLEFRRDVFVRARKRNRSKDSSLKIRAFWTVVKHVSHLYARDTPTHQIPSKHNVLTRPLPPGGWRRCEEGDYKACAFRQNKTPHKPTASS